MIIKKLIILIAFPAMFFLQEASAQEKVITGKVSNSEEGTTLSNVSIIAKGSSAGTQTDNNGNFRLDVPLPVNTLIISAIGYSSQEVDISNTTYIEVLLVNSSSMLNDVVVIGYGTSRKKDLTGAISTVSEKDFNKGIFSSPDQLIQGRVSGVQIMYNNGQPGGAAAVKIRGNSALTGTGQPLYVLDGVPIDGRSLQSGNNPLNFINTNDIASIDVLKDASATAIYGSRASYGVIIISSKKGQPGKPKLNLASSVGASSILKKIKVLNATQYRDAIKYYNVSNLNDKGGDVDALDEILQTGLQQNHLITVSGGTETGRYHLSAGAINQDGIIKNTGFKKYTFNLSSGFKFLDSKKLGLDINLNSSQYVQNVPAPAIGSTGLISSALTWNPTDPLRKADGTLNIISGNNANPLSLIELIKDNLKVTTVLGSISPYYKFAHWLEYKLLISVNYSSGTSRSSINQLIFQPNDPRGSASIGNNELKTEQVTHTLNFSQEVSSGLKINAVGGFEYTKFTMKGFSLSGVGAQGRGFGNYGLDYTNYIQFSDLTQRTIASFADPVTELKSFFGRTIFNYHERYLLTATLRADGSTKFGENNKYGYFPSFAAAWNISNEKFLKLGIVNTLKLRAGWGKTGNQEFPSGSAQTKYSFRDGGNIIQINNPNPDLRWQSDKQYNIGLDFSIVKKRISGTVDYFNKTTSNLLFPSVPIQPAPPLSVVRWINLDGKIINKGIEILLNGAIINKDQVNWDLSLNATFLKNSVTDMPATVPTGWVWGSGVGGASVEVIQNGLPMNAFYTRKFLGMDKATGFALYQDDGNTFYYNGNPNPKTLAGISSTFRYKKLSLTANMYGAFGHDIFFNTLLNVINVSNINSGKNVALSIFKDPVKESIANPVTTSSRFIVKGNYVKMANLTIDYFLGNVRNVFKDARLFLTAQNLFLITKYPGFDPEANFDGSINGVPSIGIDFVQYPSSRNIIFGINFSL